MISVIIPIYNVENYLHVCLNSILKQSYQDFEIICIDDNSNDSSFEILEYFSRKDSRIKVLKNESNRGPGYSRNMGLDVAQGKYITFLDADDWFSLDAFENLINIVEDKKLDLLIFNNTIYDEESGDFIMKSDYDEFLNNFEGKIFNHFDLEKNELFMIQNSVWNKIYLKSFLDDNDIRFSNENIFHEDYPFFYRVMTSASRVSVIDGYYYNKMNRMDSISNRSDVEFDNINVSYLILEAFLDNFQLYQYYKRELLIYIFQEILDKNYNKIKKIFKENFFKQIQTVYSNFIKHYELYEDILSSIDNEILKKFNFKDIVNEILNFKPKISLIIPCYNSEEFVESCLNSIINQTMGDIEIICINDGSTDTTLDILNKFRNNDLRVNIFSQEHMGAALSRNNGIQKVNGEYVLLIDSDDWIEPTMCEELYGHAKHLGSDLILFDAIEHNFDDKTRNRIYFPNDSFNEDYDDFIFDYTFNKNLVMNYFFVVWSKMYKQEFIKNIAFPNVPLFEDVQFHVESMLLANKISYLPKLFYHYRKLNIRSEQNFKVKTDNSLCIIDVFKGVYDFLTENKYYDEFKFNFLMFVLTESRNTLFKLNQECAKILFEKIKFFFRVTPLDVDAINEVPPILSEFYYNITNAKNYSEFQGS